MSTERRGVTVTRKSLATAVASFLIGVLLVAAVPSVALAMPGCTVPNTGAPATGNERVANGQTGVYALVEVFNPLLCVGGDPSAVRSGSFSSVLLVGGDAEAFEVGYVDCGPANGSVCSTNAGIPYYYYYYSRWGGGGSCGSTIVSTGIVKAPKGNVGATPVFHDFEVSKAADGNYYAYIDEVSQYGKAGWTIDTCWRDGAGVRAVEWAGITLDENDQLGGTMSNHQQYQNVQYKTSTGWHQVNRVPSSVCDFAYNPAFHRCSWGSTSGTFFNVWDTRSP